MRESDDAAPLITLDVPWRWNAGSSPRGGGSRGARRELLWQASVLDSAAEEDGLRSLTQTLTRTLTLTLTLSPTLTLTPTLALTLALALALTLTLTLILAIALALTLTLTRCARAAHHRCCAGQLRTTRHLAVARRVGHVALGLGLG